MAGLVTFNFYGDSMGFIVTEPCGPLPKFGGCCGDWLLGALSGYSLFEKQALNKDDNLLVIAASGSLVQFSTFILQKSSSRNIGLKNINYLFSNVSYFVCLDP